MSTIDRTDVRAAISDAYYHARNVGHTMEDAADTAVEGVMQLLAPLETRLRAVEALRDDLLSFHIGHGDYKSAGRMLGAALEHPDKPEGYTP